MNQRDMFELPGEFRPAHFTGYRIKRIELRNFGTYHGAPTSFDLDCAGSIMAGENGAGKSTAFDAVNVCFNMKPRLNNAAAGDATGGNDRTISSYYRGILGDKENDGSITKNTLRRFGDTETFMGIMIVFSNAQGTDFSAGRLLYIDDGGKNHWHYITADRTLCLRHDFPSWETSGRLKTRGERDGFETHQAFDLFMGRIAGVLGLDSSSHAQRAFRLMSLASSLQIMGSTTQFVRSYMLPEVDFLGLAEETLQAIDSHGKARAKIAMTRQQIADLEEIESQLDSLDAAFAEEFQTQRIEQNLPLVQSYVDLLSSRRTRCFHAMKMKTAQVELATCARELEGIEAEIKALDEAIRAAEGDRIDLLERELDGEMRARDRIHAQRDAIVAAALESGVPAPITADLASWQKIAIHLAGLPDLQARIEAMEVERGGIGSRIKKAEAEIEAHRTEIEQVRKSGSPIRGGLRAARAEIASVCGLKPDDMPFMGELMQVEQESRADWEFAANQLLGSPATRMLVPADHYETALAAMERSDAPVRIRLEQMNEARIGAEAQSQARQAMARLDRRAMAHKIELRDHPFSTYVRKLLADQASHLCVSASEFPKIRGKAITMRGSISHSATSAEKDGTRARDRRADYVLGWSVEDRIAALEAEITAISNEMAKDKQLFDQVDGAIQHLRDRVRRLTRLDAAMKPWDELDTTVLDESVTRLAAELARIQTDDMRARRERRERLKQEQTGKFTQIRGIENNITKRETQLGYAEESIKSKHADLRSRREARQSKLPRADYLVIRVALLKNAVVPPGQGPELLRIVPLGQEQKIRDIFDALSATYRKRLDTSMRARNKDGQAAVKMIDAYLDIYDGERNKGLTNHVRDAGIEGHHEREQWRVRLKQIRDRELALAEREAEKFRASTLRNNVMQLQGKLNTYDKEVGGIISGVNSILAQNIFNPKAGTYAKIRIDRSKDKVIVGFDMLLREALDSHTDRSEAEQFARYTAIADYLKDDESAGQRDRRRRIQFLSSRWDATIREIRILADGTDRLVRQIDGGQSLSGGERERFSAFMMGVAVNTAFNAYDEGVRARCLHTMLIDEAFGKSDSETTRAAIQVLGAFGLQIIAATPMAKIRPFEPVARTVFMISRPNNLQTAITRMDIEALDFGNLSDDDSDLENFDFAPDKAGA